MTRCPKCGSEAIKGAAFCGHCGSPLTQGDVPVRRTGMLSRVTSVLRWALAALVAFGLLWVLPWGDPIIEIETRGSDISFKTQRESDEDAWVGETEITREGRDGRKERTYLTVGDQEWELKRRTTREPVDELMSEGSKSPLLVWSTEAVEDEFLVTFGKEIDGVVLSDFEVGNEVDSAFAAIDTEASSLAISAFAVLDDDEVSAATIGVEGEGISMDDLGPQTSIEITSDTRIGISITEPDGGWPSQGFRIFVTVNGERTGQYLSYGLDE